MNNKYYWFWLSNIDGIGPRKIKKLIDIFKTPVELFKAREGLIQDSGVLSQKDFQAFLLSKANIGKIIQVYNNLEKQRIQFITVEDENYPKRLLPLYDKPYGLYVKGKIPDEDRPTAAIVGSRNCTNYGWEMAKYFGSELAKAGIQIISGMARGVDGAGQRGAVSSGGDTYGILGSGVDVCYPRENRKLYEDIQLTGGILSEQPEKTPPLARNFPMRNRLISGLSDCVIIIEAKKKSGSLITIDLALEQGKEVFALPGRLTDELSAGCNELIRHGAGILTSPEDILDFFGFKSMTTKNFNEKDISVLATEEKVLYSCLDLEPKHIEIIANETGIELQAAIVNLLELENKGMVRQTAGSYFSIKR